MNANLIRYGLVAVAWICLATEFAGCEIDEPCDPAVDPNCDIHDATGTQDGGADSGHDSGNDSSEYRYVLIEDNETSGGSEIDAVALIKNGETYYAHQVHDCTLGEGSDAHSDCERALNAPNAEEGLCTEEDNTYVNLGGVGGSLIVSFEGLVEIEEGDVIEVFECGSSELNYDQYSIFVGTFDSQLDPNFVSCTANAVGPEQCTVPALSATPN